MFESHRGTQAARTQTSITFQETEAQGRAVATQGHVENGKQSPERQAVRRPASQARSFPPSSASLRQMGTCSGLTGDTLMLRDTLTHIGPMDPETQVISRTAHTQSPLHHPPGQKSQTQSRLQALCGSHPGHLTSLSPVPLLQM